MSSESLFRITLITALIFSILSVVASFSLSDTLPIALQSYLEQTNNVEISNNELLFSLTIIIPIFIIFPISIIGLWKFKRWARTLYIIIALALIPLYPAMGPVVMNSWEAMLGDFATILEGVLIAMMFSGTIAQKFQHKKQAI